MAAYAKEESPSDEPADSHEPIGEQVSSAKPAISDYALLSNCNGSALVAKNGSIDWCCLPRFDSPAIFSQLLGDEGGYWQIAPTEAATVSRRYLDSTMVLESTYETAQGKFRIVDALHLSKVREGYLIGEHAAPAIIRMVEGLEGEAEVDFKCAPRPEFGLTGPIWVPHRNGGYSYGGPATCVLSCGRAKLDFSSTVVTGQFKVAAGEKHYFSMRVISPWGERPTIWTEKRIASGLEDTIAAWEHFGLQHESTYVGEYAEVVRRSVFVLQALCYAPSGAIVAAPTTSLPEWLGGMRNWDYRYAWVRDAGLTVGALAATMNHYKANSFFNFFMVAAAGHVDKGHRLQILYRIDGSRHVPESELEHLDGYRHSRPVRVGNGAWAQVQLDIYGELLTAALILAIEGKEFEDHVAAFLRELADAAGERWVETDAGIWEVRGGGRHYTYSKLMCWVALNAAIQMADQLKPSQAQLDHWRETSQKLKATILEMAWNDEVGAFTQAFGTNTLDAAVLMFPLVRFLDAKDERMRATIETIAEHLTDENGFVYRYRSSDGLPGGEGTFNICTCWLIAALASMGEVERAKSLFGRLLDRVNDVGLMSEELDPNTGEQLGNFPQAFTHVGIILAARAIAVAEGTEVALQAAEQKPDYQQLSDALGGVNAPTPSDATEPS